jgi:hypothetical protein
MRDNGTRESIDQIPFTIRESGSEVPPLMVIGERRSLSASGSQGGDDFFEARTTSERIPQRMQAQISVTEQTGEGG